MPGRTALPLLVAAPLLAACGLADPASPSLLPRPEEYPRRIAVAPAEAGAHLPDEERRQIEADLGRHRARLADLERALALEERALLDALGRARRAPAGSLAWADAQAALSRFEEARLPLSALILSLEDSRFQVLDLAPDDPVRAEVLSLHDRASARAASAEAAAAAARRALQR